MTTQNIEKEAANYLWDNPSKLIDLSPYKTDEYIRCEGAAIEKIEDRWRIAYVKCPNCPAHISIYQDEIDYTGTVRNKRCICRFQKTLILNNW